MARAERQDGLMLWGAVGLGVGLLAGFALAEVLGKRPALGHAAPADRILGEQEGAAPVEGDRGSLEGDRGSLEGDRGSLEGDRGSIDGDQGYPALTLADQSA